MVYVIAHADDLRRGLPPVLELAVQVNADVWFAIVVFFIRRYLAGQAARLDGLAEQRLAVETERIAE